MFGKSRASGKSAGGEPGPSAGGYPVVSQGSAAPAPTMVSGVREPAVKPSVISDAVTFVGELSSRGALHIDGNATGTIDAESITVGLGGRLDGQVRCGVLHVKGSFNGTAVCDDLIVAEQAQVEGSLTYRTILVARGSRVLGELTVAE